MRVVIVDESDFDYAMSNLEKALNPAKFFGKENIKGKTKELSLIRSLIIGAMNKLKKDPWSYLEKDYD